MKGIQDYPVGLNAFKVIHSFIFMFKQPKRRIKKTAA